jgi:hypothetical protein
MSDGDELKPPAKKAKTKQKALTSTQKLEVCMKHTRLDEPVARGLLQRFN